MKKYAHLYLAHFFLELEVFQRLQRKSEHTF